MVAMSRDAASAPLILVADDVEANVELLVDQLETLGFRTVVASDGPGAVAACFDHRPDLAILDVSMPARELAVPDRDAGYEVCRRLKKDPRTARIPVIFVTATNDTADRVKAIEAGADDFLTKPHHRLVLNARVRSLLKLKGATDALEESLKRLRELTRVRDDLMKMIVHDLKSPLTSVLATLEMMRDGDFGELNERQGRALSDAEAKAEDLLALIEDLLEVAKIEEQSITLNPEPIAPAALLAEIVHDWGLRFRQEGATATSDVADDAPVIRADKMLVKRVLSNLVQNAIKYGRKGGFVRIGLEQDSAKTRLSVTDNGIGIAAEHLPRLTERFYRVSAKDSRERGGTGLGLAIVKHIVGRHQGRLEIASKLGQGSTFTVLLPKAVSAQKLAS